MYGGRLPGTAISPPAEAPGGGVPVLTNQLRLPPRHLPSALVGSSHPRWFASDQSSAICVGQLLLRNLPDAFAGSPQSVDFSVPTRGETAAVGVPGSDCADLELRRVTVVWCGVAHAVLIDISGRSAVTESVPPCLRPSVPSCLRAFLLPFLQEARRACAPRTLAGRSQPAVLSTNRDFSSRSKNIVRIP